MSVYYIATTGNDANDGSLGSPWATIAHAITIMAGGDTLLYRGGTYNEPLRWPVGGSSGAPTTVMAYSGEIVTLVPGDNGITGSVPSPGSYVVFKNLILDGTGTSGFRNGFACSDRVVLDGLEIFGFDGNGIECHADNTIVVRCKIHNNGSNTTAGPGHGIYTTGQFNLVELSEFYDNDHYGVHIFDSGQTDVSNNTTRFNLIHGNGKSAVGLTPGGFGILLSSGDANEAYGNVLWDNGDTGLTSGGIQVKNCTNSKVLANTLYGHPIYSIIVEATADDTTVRNNIIRNAGTGGEIDDSGSGTVADHNWLDSDTDPLFTDAGSNDFSLQSTSPCIGAGADLSADGVTVDIINTPRPIDSTFDIGAYEFFTLSVPGPFEAVGSAAGTSTANASSTSEGVGTAAGVGTATGVSGALSDHGDGLASGLATVSGAGQVVIRRTAENPKTFLLRVKEARIGANGVVEWDLVREDLSIYDSVGQFPLIGSGGDGGAPGPPADPNAVDHSDASIPGSTRLVLLDIPQLLADHTGPGFYAAASGLSDGWKGAVLYEKVGQDYVEIAQLGDRAIIGKADTKLLSGDVTLFDDSGRTFVFDDDNTLDVSLIESVSSLASVSDADLFAGRNIAVIGRPGSWEVVGFGTVEQLAARKFRLSHLLRGLKGTEWAIGLHQTGDQFIMLDSALRRIKDEYSDLNVERKFRAVSIGNTFDAANDTRFTETGISLKPLSPVFIRGEADADDNRVIRFFDRSRYDGLAGRDGTETPPGDENPLRWEMDAYDGASVVRTLGALSEFFLYTAAQQTNDFGSVPSSLTVKIYKISPTLGRGYVGEATISVFDLATIEFPPEALTVQTEDGTVIAANISRIILDDSFTLTDNDDGSVTIGKAAETEDDAIEFVIEGGGSVITTGVKGDLEIPFACTITRATLLGDQSGSIVVDIWKDTYANFPPTGADSITASAKPTISSAAKSQDSTLTGWTTSISAGDILRFNVDSITTIQRATLSLKVAKT